MLGIPKQTEESLRETLQFATECDVTHISAYILKIEEGTFFHTHSDRYDFPQEDDVCNLYELCVDFLEKAGYEQYEISNFAKPGYHSRHNTKYWLLEDYLGIGAAAHSFVNGKRFYFPDSSEDFINGTSPQYDGEGNTQEEYIMLRLRLKEGLVLEKLQALYGAEATSKIKEKAPFLAKQGLVNYDGEKLSLTKTGFLLSNSVISLFL
jgi:oxygen-independent coproporphyrinogen-3 oxidase